MFSLQVVGKINRRVEEPNPAEDSAATAEVMLKNGENSLLDFFLSAEKRLMIVLTH